MWTVLFDLISLRIGVQRILGGKHGTGDHDAEKDDISEVRMIAQPVTVHSQPEQENMEEALEVKQG